MFYSMNKLVIACPTLELRNVLDQLPQEQKGQVKSAMRAA